MFVFIKKQGQRLILGEREVSEGRNSRRKNFFFPPQDVWSSRYALVKTTVMMLGEYEYEQNLFSTESLPYPTATNILFIVFIGKKN